MAALGNKVSLASGTPYKLNAAGIAGAGTLDFVVPQHDGGGFDFSGLFQAVPGGGAVTTLTASLQVSSDGVTFNDLVVAGSFISAAAPLKFSTPLFSGIITRINITAATGGFDIWVTVN